jgi:general stress protein YciG
MAIENRGFASMDKETRRRIAAMGGKASRGGGRKSKADKEKELQDQRPNESNDEE